MTIPTSDSELLKKTSENASGEGGEVGTSESSVTLDATFDSKLLDANPTSSSVKVNSMDALALVDKHLRIHCFNLLNVWPLPHYISVLFLFQD